MHNATQSSVPKCRSFLLWRTGFKYYEKAHSYIDPNSKLSISQFMLETCSGRHLEFYAKLDAIDVQILKESSKQSWTSCQN
jgi:hypothetical protein